MTNNIEEIIAIPFRLLEVLSGGARGGVTAPSRPSKGTSTTPITGAKPVPIHTVRGPTQIPKTAQQRTPTKAPMVAPPKPHRKPHSKLV